MRGRRSLRRPAVKREWSHSTKPFSYVNLTCIGHGDIVVLFPVGSPDSKRIQICFLKGDLFDRNTKLEWYCNYSITL